MPNLYLNPVVQVPTSLLTPLLADWTTLVYPRGFKDWSDFIEHIRLHGICTPLVVDLDTNGNLSIFEGNHRVEAAKRLQLTYVPVRFTENSSKDWMSWAMNKGAKV